jgi:hypothetical protein
MNLHASYIAKVKSFIYEQKKNTQKLLESTLVYKFQEPTTIGIKGKQEKNVIVHDNL